MGSKNKVHFEPFSSQQEVIDEICKYSELGLEDVAHRVDMEMQHSGWNVVQDVARYNVTPYVYNDNMETLYRSGDGFIIETMVYWLTRQRNNWSIDALDRIERYREGISKQAHELKILMLGDGTGTDSLKLLSHGYVVDYFDVPGSKTFAFTQKRFQDYGALQEGVSLITDYSQIQRGIYDVVFSFEVLEHLPDPIQAIGDIANFIRPNGIALITEAFRNVAPQLPTHLALNMKYDGKAPFIFSRCGLSLTWYSRRTRFKPMEFSKINEGGGRRLLRLLDWFVLATYISGRFRSRINRPDGNTAASD